MAVISYKSQIRQECLVDQEIVILSLRFTSTTVIHIALAVICSLQPMQLFRHDLCYCFVKFESAGACEITHRMTERYFS